MNKKYGITKHIVDWLGELVPKNSGQFLQMLYLLLFLWIIGLLAFLLIKNA